MMMMKLEEPAWRWESLPSPDELMPLSQSLITPDLALAFDIPNPTPSSNPPPPPTHTHLEFDPPAPSSDDQARTLKRPRLVWTPQLHKRFVDAVAHLGIKNAVPKTIMQLMSVDGLTRENVASHLQKYRLYLKRMQGLSSSTSPASHADDRLFAAVPHPFLNRPGPPFLQVGHVQHPHHHQHQQQYYHPQQRHVGGGFLVAGVLPPPAVVAEEAEKKVLTLFPTNEV